MPSVQGDDFDLRLSAMFHVPRMPSPPLLLQRLNPAEVRLLAVELSSPPPIVILRTAVGRSSCSLCIA